MRRPITCCLLLLAAAACDRSSEVPVVDAATTEAHDDSLALVSAYAQQALIERSVQPTLETSAAHAKADDDAADDPAIWVHPSDRSRSLIFGTNKGGGLATYDLSGEEVAYYDLGKVNNVDILYDVPLGDTTVTVLGCSNRSRQSVDLFSIDPADGSLTDIAAVPLLVDPEKIDDIYGFCLGRNVDDGTVYAILNGKNGHLEQYALVPEGKLFNWKLVRQTDFDSQTEGMVADSELGWLYVGEEAIGVWKLPLVPGKEELSPAGPQVHRLIQATSIETNPKLVADIEGIALARDADGGGYLVVSSQGNFSYALFERGRDNAFLGSFKITDAATVDGAEETDGLEVVTDSLSPTFPRGLLVVQDGFNYAKGEIVPQDFKYVDWGRVVNFPPP